MPKIKVMRPWFPRGYVEAPKALLAWETVARRLVEAKNYWICSVRPDGRPHSVPVWGAWVGDRLYYDGSPETRHARNIAANPRVSVHLESGDQAVILEATAQALTPDPDLAGRVAQDFRRKYAALGYAPEADQWKDGGLYEVTPLNVLAWTSFIDDPTKFVFAA